MKTNKTDECSPSEAITLLAGVLTVCIFAAWFGYSVMGPAMQHPAKSDRELCEERGGVYGELRGAGYRCFAPGAFK